MSLPLVSQTRFVQLPLSRPLSVCVVLLMFGASAVAQEQPVFDLDDSGDQTVLDDNPFASEADCPPEATCPAIDGTMEASQGGLFGWRRPAPHFQLPSRNYSLFRSPASYGWEYFERCQPTRFHPRGLGIPKRSSCYRMDYKPYTLRNDESLHGPAFYTRHELYPCEECHKQAHLENMIGSR